MMDLNEENYKEVINSFSEHKWKPLMELIPEIETTNNFGELEGGIGENGTFFFPHYNYPEIVSKFHTIVYDIPVIINFDWGSWDEGRAIANTNDFDFDTIDIPTKCKLITAFVRNERFCDGALFRVFESGVMLKILKSIKKQLRF